MGDVCALTLTACSFRRFLDGVRFEFAKETGDTGAAVRWHDGNCDDLDEILESAV